ncbi:MAG: hypothetical protein IKN38_03845, partial [Clostridia bacterium]|nr:hypothetical protein [Clostridia bacterium]
MQLGMSDELGPIMFGTGQSEVFLGRDFSSGRNYSEEIASKIDSEIHKIIKGAYDNAIRILNENIEKLHFIAGYLLKCEVMDGDQFKRVMEGDVTYEELDEMVAEKRARSEKENEHRRKVVEENERRRAEEREKEEKLREEKEKMRGNAGNGPAFFINLPVEPEKKDEEDSKEGDDFDHPDSNGDEDNDGGDTNDADRDDDDGKEE